MNTFAMGTAAVASGVGVGTWMIAVGVPNPLMFLVPATLLLVAMVGAEVARHTAPAPQPAARRLTSQRSSVA